MTDMNMQGQLGTDEDLQTLLVTALPLLVSMQIASRMFLKITKEQYNGPIPVEVGGNGEVTFNILFKDFTEHLEDDAYILVGERDPSRPGYGSLKSGSRNFRDYAMTKEEIQQWIDYYGVENFHVDFPRVESEEAI